MEPAVPNRTSSGLAEGKGENKGKDSNSAEVVEKVVEKVVYAPTRKRLPKSRVSRTTSFTVGGAEGYMTSGAHNDGEQIGRAPVGTQVTNAQLVCRLLLEKKNHNQGRCMRTP